MQKPLRIFISSPGDVNEERLRAHLVIQKLARDYARFFEIKAYLWEHEPMLASGHFQDAIEPPSASDVVVLILYARLGTPLPERTAVREYRGIDGRAPVTGTEWEFEDALAAHRAKGAPDLLAYRRSGDPGLSLTDAPRRAEQERQWQGLEAFWQRHFENAGMFLAGSSRFATVEEFDRKFESDLTALIERRIAEGFAGSAGGEEAKWLKGSPFRGLAAYEFDDADIFFGRDAQTRMALTRLQGAADDGCAFLLLLGASGSGKSSLARAGILPSLFVPKAIPGVGVWRRVVFRPADGGDDPIRLLALALARGDPARGIGLPEMLSAGATAEALAQHLAASADDPGFPFRLALDRVADEGRKAKRMLPHEQARLVILVDQIEELFTRGVDPERRRLFLRILAALARSGLVWVVATMRSDLWHRAADEPLLIELTEAGARVDLPRPDGAEVIEIIRRPAAAAGIAFDADPESRVGLDAVIARAAAEEPGVLPLLSVLLDTLYERDVAAPTEGRGRAHTLTFETYRALGELKGAIAERADHALNALRESDPQAAAAFPRVLRALVTVSQAGDAVTSRPALLDQFAEGGPEARLVAAFLAPEARLLVAAATAGGSEVRLAHEALLENWPAARAQVQSDRRDLETRARIEALHRRWRDAPTVADRKQALLRGLNLAEGSDLVARWSIEQSGELGAFVRTSARAERLRRSWFAASAAALVLVFATIAGFAAVESRRAEREAQAARSAEQAARGAEQAERGARQNAVQERAEAVRQRDRADLERDRAVDSEKRAVAALRATQRQSARALALQAEAAAERQEFRRALTLAVNAGETERAALDAGMPSASEPALLRAMADVRQVLHIQKAAGGPLMPYAFLDDSTLVHAERDAGVVITELAGEPRPLLRAVLPQGMIPVKLVASRPEQLVAVAGGTRLILVDARDGRTRREFTLPQRITALDLHPEKRLLAVATLNSFVLVDLATDAMAEPVAVDVGDSAVGQVRFVRSGESVLLSVGTKVVSYDLSARRFADRPVAELDATAAGFDRPLLESLVAKGLVTVVGLIPDPTRERLLMWHSAGLSAVVPGKPDVVFDKEDPALRVLGVSFTDSGYGGRLKEAIAVLARAAGDAREEIQLRFVSDDPKLLTFERFSMVADDVSGDKMDTCQVSVHATHLVCHYWGKAREGLVVFRLLGGAHRFERVFGQTGMSWGAIVSEQPRRMLLAGDAGVELIDNGTRVKVGEFPAGWAAAALTGPYLVGVSRATEETGIWRLEGESDRLAPVLGPVKATQHAVNAKAARAVLAGADRLTVYDLASGQRIATVPGLEGLRAVALSQDGRRVGALTDASVFVFDADNGRLQVSIPMAGKDFAFAFDADVERFVHAGEGGALRLLDLRTQQASVLRAAGEPVALLTFAADGRQVLAGQRNGGALAIGLDGKQRWAVPSPLGSAFGEQNAWPGQPPKGLVQALELSPDGQRLAVIRQDMPGIDLHDAADGRYLTRLTPPWAWGVPVRVSLGASGLALAIWAIHPMAQEKPAHVSLHALPFGLDAVLAAAQARLQRLETVWTPALVPAAR